MKLRLIFRPVRADYETIASLSGTILTVNGIVYDLSELPDGAEAQHPVLGKVFRDGDNYEVGLKITHGPNAPDETRFPVPIVLENFSGQIELPVYNEVT